jgi:hypothetical protein
MYRRAFGFDIWHSNNNCISWPGRNYEISIDPMDGAICLQCRRFDQITAGLRETLTDITKLPEDGAGEPD